MSELISHAYDCTIKQYIDFAFMDRRDVLTISGEPTEAEINEAFSLIQEEFSDSMNDEIDFRSDSHYLLQIYRTQQQIAIFETSIAMQRNFLEQWGEAFEDGIKFINENFATGRLIINWTGDVEAFSQQLNTAENHYLRPRRLYLAEDKAKYERELKERREKKGSQAAPTQQQSFASFMNLLTGLKTHGISFDKQKDYLIELGFAVRMIMANKRNEAATAV